MKKTITFAIISSLFLACNLNQSNTNNADSTQHKERVNMSATDSTHFTHSTTNSSFDDIISGYLDLKNALVNDNSKAASDASKKILASLEKKTNNQTKEVLEILESIKENGEHIRDNADKIDHQREHFALISKDAIDLVAQSVTSKKLYQDFCPMFNDNKGASWLSETKGIKNPYYGAEMLTCGSVKKEY
ncbi:MAG: DUF3347 domain-containing protein [Emticicia sp.]|jgi:hypothetical protein|uniref:DUF3347 domain-containing protein n=1 Tax=unclassified Emticicia TaxID=2627301 RepID=UPI003305CF15